MGKIYWTREVKTILNNKVNGIMNDLLTNKEATDQDILNDVKSIRTVKAFCDDVISEMEEMDRKEDEERKGAAE